MLTKHIFRILAAGLVSMTTLSIAAENNDELVNLFAATPASVVKPAAQVVSQAPPQTATTDAAAPSQSTTTPALAPTPAPKKEPPPEFSVWPDLPTPAEAAAFKAGAQGALPLSPEEITKFKAAATAGEKAAGMQKLSPINVSIPVSLEPGGQSPEIHVAANHGTTLILLDSTGTPWPVHGGFAPGSNDMVDVTDTKAPTKNAFIVVPKYGLSFVDTNLTLPLQDTSVPIIVRLISTTDGKYHERVELRVQRAGPNAPAAVVADDVPNLVDPTFQTVLDGVPVGMVPRKTDVAGVSVWEDRRQKMLYLRTTYQLLAPPREKEGTSADGTWAYRLPLTPYLLLSNNAGERIHVKVTGVGDE